MFGREFDGGFSNYEQEQNRWMNNETCLCVSLNSCAHHRRSTQAQLPPEHFWLAKLCVDFFSIVYSVLYQIVLIKGIRVFSHGDNLIQHSYKQTPKENIDSL